TAPEDDGGGKREREPLPAAEASAGSHREDGERDRERGRHDQPQRELRAVVSVIVPRAVQVRVVAGPLYRVDEIVDGRRLGVEGDAGPLGREVDRRLDTAEVVETLFDPRRTAGAGHAFELQLDAFSRRGHSTSIP